MFFSILIVILPFIVTSLTNHTKIRPHEISSLNNDDLMERTKRDAFQESFIQTNLERPIYAHPLQELAKHFKGSQIPFHMQPDLISNMSEEDLDNQLREEAHYDINVMPDDINLSGWDNVVSTEILTDKERLWIRNLELIEKFSQNLTKEPDGLLDMSPITSTMPKNLLLEEHQIRLTDREFDGDSVHPFDTYFDVKEEADVPYYTSEFEPLWKDTAPSHQNDDLLLHGTGFSPFRRLSYFSSGDRITTFTGQRHLLQPVFRDSNLIARPQVFIVTFFARDPKNAYWLTEPKILLSKGGGFEAKILPVPGFFHPFNKEGDIEENRLIPPRGVFAGENYQISILPAKGRNAKRLRVMPASPVDLLQTIARGQKVNMTWNDFVVHRIYRMGRVLYRSDYDGVPEEEAEAELAAIALGTKAAMIAKHQAADRARRARVAGSESFGAREDDLHEIEMEGIPYPDSKLENGLSEKFEEGRTPGFLASVLDREALRYVDFGVINKIINALPNATRLEDLLTAKCEQLVHAIKMRHGVVKPLAEYYHEALVREDWRTLRVLERLRVRAKYSDLQYLHSKAVVTLTFLYEPYFRSMMFDAFESFDTHSLHLLTRLAERRIWRALKLIAMRTKESRKKMVKQPSETVASMKTSQKETTTTTTTNTGEASWRHEDEILWLATSNETFHQFDLFSISKQEWVLVHLANGTDFKLTELDVDIPETLLNETRLYLMEESLVKDHLFYRLLSEDYRNIIRQAMIMDTWHITGYPVAASDLNGTLTTRPSWEKLNKPTSSSTVSMSMAASTKGTPTTPETTTTTLPTTVSAASTQDNTQAVKELHILDPAIVCAKLLQPLIMSSDLIDRLIDLVDFTENDKLIQEQRVVLRKAITKGFIPLEFLKVPYPLDHSFTFESRKQHAGRYWFKRDVAVYSTRAAQETWPHGLDWYITVDVPVIDSRMRSIRKRAEQLLEKEFRRHRKLRQLVDLPKEEKQRQLKIKEINAVPPERALNTLFFLSQQPGGKKSLFNSESRLQQKTTESPIQSHGDGESKKNERNYRAQSHNSKAHSSEPGGLEISKQLFGRQFESQSVPASFIHFPTYSEFTPPYARHYSKNIPFYLKPTYTMHHERDPKESRYTAAGLPLIPTDFTGFPERLRLRFEAFQLMQYDNLENQLFYHLKKHYPKFIFHEVRRAHPDLLKDILDKWEPSATHQSPMLQFFNTSAESKPKRHKSLGQTRWIAFQRALEKYQEYLRWLTYHSMTKKVIVSKMNSMGLFPEVDLMVMNDPSMGFRDLEYIRLPTHLELALNRFIEDLSDDLHRMILVRDFAKPVPNEELPLKYSKDTMTEKIAWAKRAKKESKKSEWFDFLIRYYHGSSPHPTWQRFKIVRKGYSDYIRSAWVGFLIDRREDYSYFFRGDDVRYEPEVSYRTDD